MVINSGLDVTIDNLVKLPLKCSKDVNIMEVEIKSKYVPTYLIVPTFKAEYELVDTFEISDEYEIEDE
jgi:hypothetical protein